MSIYDDNNSSDPIENIDEFIEDLYERRESDLMYEYSNKSIKRIESALKLQELVKEVLEKRMGMGDTPQAMARSIGYNECTEIFQSLVEESERG